MQELRQDKRFKFDELLQFVDLSRSTYYYQLSLPAVNSSDDKIVQQIKRIKSGKFTHEYGYPRVTQMLRDLGYLVNHKRVYRLMKEHNLLSTLFKRKTRRYNSYKGTIGIIQNRVIKRDFKSTRPYEKIVTDVTEVKLKDKQRVYITAYLDLYANEVLAHDISTKPTMNFVLTPLKSILKRMPIGVQTVFHSDQGFHYQTPAYQRLIKDHHHIQSMSRKSTPLDNAPIESFFHVMKEVALRNSFDSFKSLKQEINAFIKYYNNDRFQSKLGMSPVQYRQINAQSI